MSITCSSDFGVTTIDWLLDGRVVPIAVGSEGELSISEVHEDDHDRMYTCRATAPFGVQEHNITLQVEGMHPLSKHNYSHKNLSIIITPHACVRGKVISLYVLRLYENYHIWRDMHLSKL